MRFLEVVGRASALVLKRGVMGILCDRGVNRILSDTQESLGPCRYRVGLGFSHLGGARGFVADRLFAEKD